MAHTSEIISFPDPSIYLYLNNKSFDRWIKPALDLSFKMAVEEVIFGARRGFTKPIEIAKSMIFNQDSYSIPLGRPPKRNDQIDMTREEYIDFLTSKEAARVAKNPSTGQEEMLIDFAYQLLGDRTYLINRAGGKVERIWPITNVKNPFYATLEFHGSLSDGDIWSIGVASDIPGGLPKPINLGGFSLIRGMKNNG